MISLDRPANNSPALPSQSLALACASRHGLPHSRAAAECRSGKGVGPRKEAPALAQLQRPAPGGRASRLLSYLKQVDLAELAR